MKLINLQLEGSSDQLLYYNITDIVGHVITNKQPVAISTGHTKIEIANMNLKSGVYVLQLLNMDGTITDTIKFSKE